MRPAHLPATCTHLTTILTRRDAGLARLTTGERLFVFACEFWALVMARDLHTRERQTALSQLRCAAIIFEAIGAPAVASALRSAHLDLLRSRSSLQRRRQLRLLEDRLRLSAGLVAPLLGQLADNLATADSCAQLRRRAQPVAPPYWLH